jgi:MFS family permease
MSASILGGAFGQLPIGYYSDRVDRRWVLMVVMVMATLVSLLLIPFGESAVLWVLMALWGAAVFAIYPVAIAYMVDHVDSSEIISASSAILLIYGIGAAVGPAVAGVLMGVLGRTALPAFFAVILAVMVGVLLVSMRRKPVALDEPSGHFSPMMRSTPQVLEMMPDAPEEAEELSSDQISAVMPAAEETSEASGSESSEGSQPTAAATTPDKAQ